VGTNNTFELSEVEAEHHAQIPDEQQKRIGLANDAAILTLNCLAEPTEEIVLNTPRGIMSLLLAKAAQDLCCACNCLWVGYYSGALSVLRPAFDGLAYAALMRSRPNEIGSWLRNEFSTKRPRAALAAQRSQQRQRALRALLEEVEQADDIGVIHDEMRRYRQLANTQVHPSFEGLAEEFGVAIGSLLPDDLDVAHNIAAGDFEQMLQVYADLKSDKRVTFTRTSSEGAPKELVRVRWCCQYNKDRLDDAALFAFYIAHRLLDFTKGSFETQYSQFAAEWMQWHADLRSPAQA